VLNSKEYLVKSNKFLAVIATLASLGLAACGEHAAPENGPGAGTTAPEASGNDAAEAATLEITADLLRAYVRELSDDKYEGRGPGSRGDVAARKYLAEELEKLGLQPGAADGSWEQPFDLVGITSEQPAEWSFAGHDNSLTLKQWDDFIVSSGVQADRAEVENAVLVQSDEYFLRVG